MLPYSKTMKIDAAVEVFLDFLCLSGREGGLTMYPEPEGEDKNEPVCDA